MGSGDENGHALPDVVNFTTSGNGCYQSPTFPPLTEQIVGSGNENALAAFVECLPPSGGDGSRLKKMTGSYITTSCIVKSFFKISIANGNYTSDYSDLIREEAQKTKCLQPCLSSWLLISAFDETYKQQMSHKAK